MNRVLTSILPVIALSLTVAYSASSNASDEHYLAMEDNSSTPVSLRICDSIRAVKDTLQCYSDDKVIHEASAHDTRVYIIGTYYHIEQ